MADSVKSFSPLKYARLVGFLYLAIFFLGPLAFFMGRTSVVVPNDPSATVESILTSSTMFRAGMVAEVSIVLIEIIISSLLFVLLKPINHALSLAAALARYGQSMIQAANLLTALPAVLIITGASYISAFSTPQRDALVLLFSDINAFMIMIWGILFGFHLLLLGYLVHQSNFWPKFLGVLLFIGGIGYLSQSFGHLIVPQFDQLLANLVIILSIPGELAFTLWLLIKGINTRAWKKLSG